MSGCLPPLFKTNAVVIERNAVGIKTFTTGSIYPNLLRNEVDYLTELRFLLADLVFRSLAVFDIRQGNIPTRSLADRINAVRQSGKEDSELEPFGWWFIAN
jgi:hypothetical protein